MKRVFFVCLLFCSLLLAKTDFSEMSTEELIALIGYVDQSKDKQLYQELEKRIESMSEEQKRFYEEDKQRRDNAKN